MENILDILKQCNQAVIAGHTSPDGDCIGSCFALAYALKKLDKKVYVLLERIPKRFEIIPGAEFLYEDDYSFLSPDVFISLDCGDKKRLGAAALVFDNARVRVCIDHHASNIGFADYNYIEADASSTCEIIYKLINGHVPLDARIASALYAGIVDDTGGFCHACTKPIVHEIAAKLISVKIPFNEIYNEIRNIRSIHEITSLKMAISNMTVLEDRGVAYSSVSKAQMEAAGIEYTDFEGVAEFLVNIEGVSLSFFVYEKPEGAKASLRSKDEDVSVIAARLGGGGHRNAAGLTVNASVLEVVDMILEEI